MYLKTNQEWSILLLKSSEQRRLDEQSRECGFIQVVFPSFSTTFPLVEALFFVGTVKYSLWFENTSTKTWSNQRKRSSTLDDKTGRSLTPAETTSSVRRLMDWTSSASASVGVGHVCDCFYCCWHSGQYHYMTTADVSTPVIHGPRVRGLCPGRKALHQAESEQSLAQSRQLSNMQTPFVYLLAS